MREHDNTSVLSHRGRHAGTTKTGASRDRHIEELLADARSMMVELRDEDALHLCRAALELSPECEEALVLASTLCTIKGEPQRGLRLALEVVQLDPFEADGYYEVAMCLLDMGHPEEALDWLDMGQRYTQGRRDDIDGFFTAARVEALGVLFRYEEAIAALEEGLSSHGDEMGMLEDAGMRLEQLKTRTLC